MKWISVKDGLPKNGVVVLAMLENEYSLVQVLDEEWYNNDGFYLHNIIRELIPTHWMPLPEPPNVTRNT